MSSYPIIQAEKVEKKKIVMGPKGQNRLLLAMLLIVLLANQGCAGISLSTPTLVTATATEPISPTATTALQPTDTNVTTTPPITIEKDLTPALLIQEEMGPLYEEVMTIPVGEDGVQYRGVGIPNMEITGPNALAVLPDESFVVADLIDNRLLRYDSAGHPLKTIDLFPRDIVNISDLRASETGLFVLEINFNVAPQRYKVHHLSFEGDLKASYEIPESFHLENGLSGITIGSQGQIILEMEGGAKLYQLGEQPDIEPVRVAGYPFYGKTYELDNSVIGETVVIKADRIQLKTKLSKGLGGINFLKAFLDGSFYIIRNDVVNDQVIQVDQTVHYISANGVQQGVARVPLAEYYYPVMRNLAVSPRGDVFALLPRPDSVHIIRLNFYKSIEPLIPGAVKPSVMISNQP